MRPFQFADTIHGILAGATPLDNIGADADARGALLDGLKQRVTVGVWRRSRLVQDGNVDLIFGGELIQHLQRIAGGCADNVLHLEAPGEFKDLARVSFVVAEFRDTVADDVKVILLQFGVEHLEICRCHARSDFDVRVVRRQRLARSQFQVVKAVRMQDIEHLHGGEIMKR